MNKAEENHQKKVAALGCIACLLNGVETPYVSLHHVEGRAKKGAHMKVIPLCGSHHQTGELALHKNRARFEAAFGTEEQLLALVDALLGGLYLQSELLELHDLALENKDGPAN